MILYDRKKWDRLRYKFGSSDKLEKNYSQAYQDMFVLTMLNGKREGTYLEIGAMDPVFINNTYLLETAYGWKGVSIDIDKASKKAFSKHRKNNLFLADAVGVDYAALLARPPFGKRIDYLSLDIEPNTQTLECLKKLPLSEYRFSVVTYETDYYDKNQDRAISELVREESRKIFRSHGYEMVVGNIANTGPDDIFEDWYVDPAAVDAGILSAFRFGLDFNDAAEKFMLTE